MGEIALQSGFAILAVVTGWVLHEVSSVMAFRRTDREAKRVVYQAAFAKLRQLYDALDPGLTYNDVRSFVDDLQAWWYSNSLSLDKDTNEALVGVVSSIRSNMLPKPRADNILLIDNVAEAFDQAETAIRQATD